MKAATPAEPVPPLNYATPHAAPLDPQHYQTALFCGWVPLAACLVLYVLWAVAANSFLLMVSLATMVCGVVMFCVGALCLVMFLVQVSRQPQSIRRRWWPRLFLAGMLLLGNAAACFGIVWMGLHILNSMGV